MAGKGINKIKARRLKKGLLEGKSYKQAMISAGYAETTGRAATKTTVLQRQLKAIEEEFKLSDITPEYVIGKLTREAEQAIKSSDRTAALALLGKYLALFSDRLTVKAESTLKPDELKPENMRIELKKAMETLDVNDKTIVSLPSPESKNTQVNDIQDVV